MKGQIGQREQETWLKATFVSLYMGRMVVEENPTHTRLHSRRTSLPSAINHFNFKQTAKALIPIPPFLSPFLLVP